MPRHLAAERGARVAHARLEEGVTHAVDLGDPANPRDHVANRPRRPHVVEDRRARLLAQDRLRKQRGQEVAGHELAGVVDEEAAVAVAVPGDTEIGACLADLVDDEAAVLLEQRVRLVVGELAVRLPVGRHLLDRKRVEQRSDHRSGHAVAAVEDDLQRA